jgi:hypothetical protein
MIIIGVDFHPEFQQIASVDTENRLRAGLGCQSKSNSFNESEMALFYECMLKCALKLLDTADIVREAIYRQLRQDSSFLLNLENYPVWDQGP